ncbi:MAG TPA: hypothetical protein VGP93_05140, partial [Polyangiaceae bacterium]|nr:hypothetical protein [Polyangiaceae bacterium]
MAAVTSTSDARRWDLGRTLARILCAVLGAIGLLPVAAALLVSSSPVQRWAEVQTRRLLERELGVAASYSVSLRLLPLRLSITNLVVPASDGGEPALRVESVSASPRVFSLLAGTLDLGDIELHRPRARLVFKDSKLVNVKYRLPQHKGQGTKNEETPFFTLAVTEGRFDVDLDGTQIETGPVDLDVFAEQRGVFELSLHASKTYLRRARTQLTQRVPTTGSIVHDDDVLCRLEARVHVDKTAVLVRRVSLLGVADGDPAAGPAPSCERADEQPRQVAVRLSQLKIEPRKGQLPLIQGHAVVRAPIDLLNRFVRTLEVRGWAALAADIDFDGSHRLPELRGNVTGAGIEYDCYKLAKELGVEIRVKDDVIEVPSYHMLFADGDVQLRNARIEPFAPGSRIEVEGVEGKGMQFSALMRDLGVTPNTIIYWDLNKTNVRKINGTLKPLKIDAEITAETRDFEVFDRAYHDKNRKHMIGVKRALVRGKLGVRPNSFDIYDTRTDFGKSTMQVALVSIGFSNDIKLSIPKGGSKLDLADISPLVDITMAGQAEIDAEMSGMAKNPVLTGGIKISGFEFGGFPLGDLKSGKVRFRPLWL